MEKRIRSFFHKYKHLWPLLYFFMKKSRPVYRQLVERAVDIGDGNPMAYNELFALAFVAPYVASGKKIQPQTVQEMMRRSLYHIKWYFARTDLNTARGKAENKKSIVKYVRWYTPRRERRYPPSFKVDFVGQPHADACRRYCASRRESR